MTQSWLLPDQVFPDPWMGPVLQALRKAADKGSLPEAPKELGELSLHISTRLGMIKRLVERVNQQVEVFLRSAQAAYTPDHVFTSDREGCALRTPQGPLYDLLIDLDALLFELNAEGDLFKELLSIVHEHVGQAIPKKKLGERLVSLLKANGSDTDWFLRLDSHRNFFAHNGSPYIAIDKTTNPWELLIAKSNLKRFDDPSSFFTLEEVNQIVQGFSRAKGVFQKYLVTLCLPNG